MNLFLVSNLLAGFLWFVFLFISLFLEGFKWKKISIKHMAIVSILISLNVILTNLISYNINLFGNGLRIAFGDWILFLIGMIFGPLIGWVAVFCADGLGTIVNLGGAYHCGYMLDKFVLAFLGSMVFLSKKNNLIIFKTFILYALALFLESFVLNPIWTASLYGWAVVVPTFVTKAIKYFFEIPIYITFVLTSLRSLKIILIQWQASTYIWCLRNDSNLDFNFKKIFINSKLSKNNI